MKEIQFYASSSHQVELFKKAAKGARKYGIRSFVSPEDPTLKNVACWGWRNGRRFRAHGHNVLVFERGYLGDRFKWTSVAWNGLNNYGDFCLPEKVSFDRFEQNFTMKPWRHNGDLIVVMGQVPGDMSLRGRDLTEFYTDAGKRLAAIHKKEVVFRPHPVGVERGCNFRPRLKHVYGDLQETLDKAFMVVTFNSNAGVDAVINGIPALSFDKGSMAYEVTGHKFSDRITPDREDWAARLAHCQWTPDEITNGDYWERMACRLVS